MTEEGADQQRVRLFVIGNSVREWYVPRVVQLAEQFDPKNVPTSVEDIIELYNVQQYLEHGLLPGPYTEEERDRAKARIPQIRTAVARFFRRSIAQTSTPR